MKSSYFLKKKKDQDEEIEGSWAISYGDMITLLLSFFVIFFSTDHKSENLKKANAVLEDHIRFDAIKKVNEPVKRTVATENFSDFNIKVYHVDEMILVSFGAFSFFDSGEVTVREEGQRVLSEFAKKIIPFVGHYTVSVKGFTDKRKVIHREGVFKKFEDNLELSALRSVNAIKVLQKSGIPLNQMEIAGAGEMQAIQKIIPNSSELTESQINAYSRTILVVIRPQKESWL